MTEAELAAMEARYREYGGNPSAADVPALVCEVRRLRAVCEENEARIVDLRIAATQYLVEKRAAEDALHG
jgi:hypothetical protein